MDSSRMSQEATLDSRYLGIGAPVPEHLYRICSLAKALDWLTEGVNFLSAPLLWDDPWEAVQLKTQLESPLFVDEKGVYSSGMRDNKLRRVGGTFRQGGDAAGTIFCQCWSSTAESDTMWRAYSPESNCVKLKVRTETLFASHVKIPMASAFLGQVQYVPDAEINELMADPRANYRLQVRTDLHAGLPGEAWARSLLKKREQFRHEEEYRLILVPDRSDQAVLRNVGYRHAVPFSEIVLEVEIDPRASTLQPFVDSFRSGGFCGKVSKSSLYQVPATTVRPSWPVDVGWNRGSDRVWRSGDV